MNEAVCNNENRLTYESVLTTQLINTFVSIEYDCLANLQQICFVGFYFFLRIFLIVFFVFFFLSLSLSVKTLLQIVS